ncbi:hypothetical protein [Vibrio sp. 10N.247.310.17]|uniref:hypothetical protein n=1 Tax=Vibrio sp. 10N.247.310.17 TaxID=3229979 RepID=UPI003551FAD6
MVLDALSKCDLAMDSKLYIHQDFPRNNAEENAASEFQACYQTIENKFASVEIVKQSENLGCDRSMLWMMDYIFKKYEKVIVLEDDDVPSIDFLKYMNFCLDKYESDKTISGISGYCPPINIVEDYEYEVFKSPRGASWGWGTWKSEWNDIDWKATKYKQFKHSFSSRRSFAKGGEDMFPLLKHAIENKEFPHWDIIRCFDMFNKDKYFLFPVKSYVKNIGFDGSGTNCNSSTKYEVDLIKRECDWNNFPKTLDIEPRIVRSFHDFYSYSKDDGYIVSALKYIGLFDTALEFKCKFLKK